MSALAVQAPALLPSPRGIMWENRRAAPEVVSRPPPPLEKIELPSIRQAIPEIHQVRSVPTEPEYRPNSASYSPTTLVPPHEHTQSPSLKRRRLSAEDDLDTRDHVKIIHRSPPRSYQTQSTTASPRSGSRRLSEFSIAESWTSSTRTSPLAPTRGPQMVSAAPFDSSAITRSDWRPQLPSLPALTFDRATVPAPRAPTGWSEYGFNASSRAAAQTLPPQPISPTDPPPAYHRLPLSYTYHQPRGLSYSGPSTGHTSPTLFANSHPVGFAGFPYAMDVTEIGSESKQRKRRGNLPKETTDKLRAWFLSHLQHPYPTEDEKQELMRQTGLQMNQISNWFINARRRQLPAMINNARAESDVKTAGEGKGEGEGEGKGETKSMHESGQGVKGNHASGESEGEGSSYEDEYEALGRRRSDQGMAKRESI